jgi:hypothetical protein
LRSRTGLPWVADLRDLWIQNQLGYPLSSLRKLIDVRLERRWLSTASRITTASEGMVALLGRAGYAGIPMTCVYNGYLDPLALGPGAGASCGGLRVCHTGTLYGRDYTAEPFFAALARLRQIEPAAVAEVRFYGAVDATFPSQVARFGLADVVSFGGRLTGEHAVCVQRESDVLLLLLPDNPNTQATVLSKTFDYLAARRAILGVLPETGENALVLRAVGVKRVFSPRDADGIANALSEMAALKRQLGLVPPEADAERVRAFHYGELAGVLARELDAAVETQRC